jgi:hypothetical protein
MNAELFRIHPVTGKHAEDTEGLSDELKQEFASIMRAGGQVYWVKEDQYPNNTIEGYVYVEKSNIAFVVHATGGTLGAA